MDWPSAARVYRRQTGGSQASTTRLASCAQRARSPFRRPNFTSSTTGPTVSNTTISSMAACAEVVDAESRDSTLKTSQASSIIRAASGVWTVGARCQTATLRSTAGRTARETHGGERSLLHHPRIRQRRRMRIRHQRQANIRAALVHVRRTGWAMGCRTARVRVQVRGRDRVGRTACPGLPTGPHPGAVAAHQGPGWVRGRG